MDYAVAVLGALAFGLGVGLSRFLKSLDKYVQTTQEFQNMSEGQKMLLRALIDIVHHWEIGLLLIYLALRFASGDIAVFLQLLGWGLFISDTPDIPPRYIKIFRYLKQIYAPFVTQEEE